VTTAPKRGTENAEMAAGAATPAPGLAPRGAGVYVVSLASLALVR
jgi:hypothetical protein